MENLQVNNNNLTFLPSEIGNLSNLKVLYLNENDLTSIPIELVNLTTLEELHLSYNDFAEFPHEVISIPNLQKLTIDVNNLDSIPPQIENFPVLKSLDLSFNNLSTLPSEIGNITNLEYLYLGYCSLISLPESILNLKNLKYIRVMFNKLKPDNMSNELVALLDSLDPDWKDTQDTSSNIINTIESSKKFAFKILQNSNNPVIKFYLPNSAKIKLQVFKANGRLVETLIDGHKQAGNHSVKWNGGKRKSGVYLIKLAVGNKAVVEKKIVVK